MKAKKGKQLAQELIEDLLGSGDKKQSQSESTVSAVVSDKHVSPNVKAGVYSGANVSLAQAENLRIAQQKILDLESETERLRQENEALAAAAETLRKRADELMAESEAKKSKYEQAHEAFIGEKEILETSVKSKEREVSELKLKEEEYEMRLTTNIQKIRVRERELENRLEMVKVESSALIRAKDEMILDLKRQLDQMGFELENYRNKSTDLNKTLSEKQAMLQRTVRALRIALSMLEGDRATGEEELQVQKKKA